MKGKLITNVSCVQYKDARLWALAIYIREPFKVFKEGDTRQIRGLGWGGLEVFTLWIDPEAEVKIEPSQPSGATFIGDATGTRDLFGGVTLSVGDLKILAVAEDGDKPIAIEDIPDGQEVFGDYIDERILKYAAGSNYPRVVWSRMPGRPPGKLVAR